MRWLLILCAVLLGSVAKADESPSLVIPPGQESVVLRFLEPLKMGQPVAGGCNLQNVGIQRDHIDLDCRCADGAHLVRLVYPRSSPAGIRAGVVDLVPEPGTPPALIEGLRSSLADHPHSALPWSVPVDPEALAKAATPAAPSATPAPPQASPRRHHHPPEAPSALAIPLLVVLLLAAVLPRWRNRLGAEALRLWREERGLVLLAAGAWLVGAVLRLSLAGVIEYKGDEDWMYGHAEDVWRGARWPLIGMSSSVNVPNPGASVWVFMLLTRLSGADSPIELSRAVAVLNLLALAVLFVHALRLSAEERRPWVWAAALAAVDPLGVIMQRKIWAQSVLPLFCVLFLIAWRRRDRVGAAFAWGVLGALLGQLHMSGFIYAAAFLLWTIALSVSRGRSVRWLAWGAGTLVGLIGLVPWLQMMRQHSGFLAAVLKPAFRLTPWRNWLEDVVGLDLQTTLGPAGWRAFLGQPVVIGAYIAVAIAIMVLLVGLMKPTTVLVPTDGTQAFLAAFVLYCALLAVAPFTFFRHYLFVAFPFESLTLPLLGAFGLRRSWPLGVVFAAHVVLSAALLLFLQTHHGAPDGDFGVAFQFQEGG